MKTNEILCSTGAFVGRINNFDYTLIPKFARQLNCDGFEFMMLDAYYDKTDEIASMIKKNKVCLKTFHIEKDIGYLWSRNEGDDCNEGFCRLVKNLKFAQILGIDFLILHLWGGLPSDENIDRSIEYIGRISELVQRYKMTLTIENVPCTRYTPYANFLKIKRLFPNMKFTFDTRFAAYHSEENIFLSDRKMWENNIEHIHISDISAQSIREKNLRPILFPNEGVFDFDKLFSHLSDINYKKRITLESPVFSYPYNKEKMLNNAIEYIRTKTDGNERIKY